VHNHKLRPVMEAIEEEEMRVRRDEIESLEEGLKDCSGVGGVTEGHDRNDDKITHTGGEIRPRTHDYVNQSEWMAIQMAEKGPGFW
jgi:hypothetical protein